MSGTNSISRAYGTVACPVCQVQIPLQQKEGNPLRLVAKHACKGQPYRTVLERDTPQFPPATLVDRIDQTEHTDETAMFPIKKKKR
jgi:hypothetical protein